MYGTSNIPHTYFMTVLVTNWRDNATHYFVLSSAVQTVTRNLCK